MCYCEMSEEEAERRQADRDWAADHNEDPGGA